MVNKGKEFDSEKSAGVCEWCGRFNLGDVSTCEYCHKPLKKKIIAPQEGI